MSCPGWSATAGGTAVRAVTGSAGVGATGAGVSSSTGAGAGAGAGAGTGTTVIVWVCCGAAVYWTLSGASASMTHTPTASKVTTPASRVHTALEDAAIARVTVIPVAESVAFEVETATGV
ncbi:MAG TPA: hypothetical protein DCQ36_03345 [Actinobacteria bacterium]|nr:hypothetical protein [Actinomycetota bacterium]